MSEGLGGACPARNEQKSAEARGEGGVARLPFLGEQGSDRLGYSRAGLGKVAGHTSKELCGQCN